MAIPKRRWFSRSPQVLLTWLLAGSLSLGSLLPPAQGETEAVPMERLHVHDVLLLPTVRSRYETGFTKPKTWKLTGDTYLDMTFQHSHQLLPNRSWLEVVVNNKALKRIPLTKENAESTNIKVPIPAGSLTDFNTLAFRVEQHYTDMCEDPLDKSLWTQILPNSKLVFNYTPTLPAVDLAGFPYPIIDPLAYTPEPVRYVIPESPGEQELLALSYVNVYLAQQTGKKEFLTQVARQEQGYQGDGHLVYVGLPGQLRGLSNLSVPGYSLQGGQWVNNQTGQPLNGNEGFIAFFPHPRYKNRAVLVVSGNTPQGVLQAATYLTNAPKVDTLVGQAATAPDGWNPPNVRSAKVPRYVENQTRTFAELGYPVQSVEKINAPPIVYHIPIVGDFSDAGSKLYLDLAYSYGPEMNPTFSSLEVKMNDISIANIPLLNVNGEEMRQVTIPISNELVEPDNDLVVQFHMMPDKFGRCVNNFEDKAWGKVLDTSKLRVEGRVGSRLPDVGLLNDTGFPYTREDHMDNMHIVVPENPSDDLLRTMLAFTARLGRATLADTDLRFALSKGGSNLPGDKNLVVIRQADQDLSLPQGYRMKWTVDNALAKLQRLFHWQPGKDDGIRADLLGNEDGIYLEQYMANNNKVVTVLEAESAKGLISLRRLFEDDKQFEQIAHGPVMQLTNGPADQGRLDNLALNDVKAGEIYEESGNKQAGGNWWTSFRSWLSHLPWPTVALWALGGLLIFFLLPSLLFRPFRRK